MRGGGKNPGLSSSVNGKTAGLAESSLSTQTEEDLGKDKESSYNLGVASPSLNSLIPSNCSL